MSGISVFRKIKRVFSSFTLLFFFSSNKFWPFVLPRVYDDTRSTKQTPSNENIKALSPFHHKSIFDRKKM